MKNDKKLFSRLQLALVAFAVIAVVAPAGAGVVQFTGKLRSGFGNSHNLTDAALSPGVSNNGLPVCAVTNPFALQTWGTLYVQGFAQQTTVMASNPDLVIDGYRPMGDIGGVNFLGDPGGNGGAFPRYRATCQVRIPPFFNPRLRSRTQYAGGGWPDAVGGTLGTGRGIDIPNTTMGAPASHIQVPIPFLTGGGYQEIWNSAKKFGGGVGVETTGPIIYSSYVSENDRGLGNGVQLGINVATLTTMGGPLQTFGLIPYIGGYLPTGPNGLGQAGVTHRVLHTSLTSMGGPIASPLMTCVVPPGTLMTGTCPMMGLGAMTSTQITQGIHPGHQTTYDNFFGFRTPGGSTQNQQGAIQTVYGGNTVTNCVAPGSTAAPCPLPGIGLNSTFQIRIAVQEGTTGTVKHWDNIGDYITSRQTTGVDSTGLAGTAGTTRRIQTVVPWSATIRGVGPFPVKNYVPKLGFGGLASTELNLVPVPEPGSAMALGFGAMALFGLNRARRRS